MKIKLKYTFIILIILSTVLYVLYIYYGNYIDDHLIDNQEFHATQDESNIIENVEDYNFMFFTWESEKLNSGRMYDFEKLSLQFINDSTALLMTKSANVEGRLSFIVNYLFGRHIFYKKNYQVLKMENDTLYTIIYNEREKYKSGYDIFFKDVDITIEQIETLRKFKPTKRYATFKLDGNVLKLSEFNFQEL